MRSRTREFFYCEYCGKEFSDEYECASHEGSHLKDFSCSTKKGNRFGTHKFIGERKRL